MKRWRCVTMKSPGSCRRIWNMKSLTRSGVCLAAIIEEQLAIYKTRQTPLIWAGGARVSGANTRARVIDVARIVIDQAVRLGAAQADFTDCQPNGSRLMITEPRYRRMSLTNIEQVMPVAGAGAMYCAFPALDSALRSPPHWAGRTG